MAAVLACDDAILFRTLLAAVDAWGDPASLRATSYDHHRHLTAVES